MSLKEFLLTVDEKAPRELDDYVKLFMAAGFDTRLSLVGVNESEVDSIAGVTDLQLPQKAFLRRAVRLVNATADATAASTAIQALGQTNPIQAPLQLPVAPTADINDIVSNEFAAATLTKLLSSGVSNEIDTAALFKAAKLGTVPFHMTVDKEVNRLMEAENLLANKAPKRVAFSFVDLTSNAILPMWLPPDTIGGSSPFSPEMLDGNTNSLQAMGKALLSATMQKKIFRTHAQWMGCFTKYAIAAIAAEQLTMAQVLTYLCTLSRLQNDERSHSFFHHGPLRRHVSSVDCSTC